MAKINNLKENDFEIKLKKHKRNRHIFIMVFFLFIVIAGISFNIISKRQYNTYKILSSVERTDSGRVQYEKLGKNLLKYSRDGASVFDDKGEVIWNGTYDMQEPKVDICGNYVAVADLWGKNIHVYDEKGKAGTVDTLLPILQVKVAKQGVIAVLLQDKKFNEINLYNPYDSKDPLLYKIPTTMSVDGYPIDIDISEDGLKLVTSYLSVNNGVTENTISFYSFNEVGENFLNHLTGAYMNKQAIVPKVKFITNDIVVAFAENGFTIYSMKETPDIIYKGTFKSEVKSIFSDDAHIGFVLEDSEGSGKNKVEVYNLRGKKVLDKTIDYNYEKVQIYGKDIIFYSNTECFILRLNGSEKFHGTFDKNVSYLFPINNFDKFYVIDDRNMEEIKLMEDKKQ